MTQYGTWVSYGGDARIELAAGLLAAAGCAAYAGIRLRLPVRAVRPGKAAVIGMLAAWVVAIAAFLAGAGIYIRHYVHEYDLTKAAPPDRIAPVTLLAAAALAGIILTRTAYSFPARLGGAVVAAIAAPMIFELPFDLIVMARLYPPVPPDPALYAALFFAPLVVVEVATLSLLTWSPLVSLSKATFFFFALMLAVFAVWALFGFAYPSAPAPIALNVVSKILAFVAALSLFLPQRARASTTGPAASPAGMAVPAGQQCTSSVGLGGA